jgi:hypothetical protein
VQPRNASPQASEESDAFQTPDMSAAAEDQNVIDLDPTHA